jgi:site-specific DNA recombinase
LTHLDDTEASPVIHCPDSTLGGTVESMGVMKKAALYARVSTDAQEKEGTIESQLFELRRQIDAAGHVLVKEYIDDGISGKLLDRPALNQMRADLKTDLFDTIYFHSADRITREVAYQTIIIDELRKRGKQIVIDGKDYIENPENKLTLTMLGAFAEFERAKIIERMMRGKLHRLRQGQVVSQGHCIYGYDYVRKSPLSPPALVISEQEAATVRLIFEMYAEGTAGPDRIARLLEERGIPTRKGNKLWLATQIKSMLSNHTYTGLRYYNRMTTVKNAPDGKSAKRGTLVYRDRSEWIGVKVPAIVCHEVFDKAQERLREGRERYRQPAVHYLLSGMIECGECGWGFSSYRRYIRKKLLSGKRRIHHKAAYKCNRRAKEAMHSPALIQRCRNPEIQTHMLEAKVFEMIREVMLDPLKLRECMDFFRDDSRPDRSNIQGQLTRIQNRATTIEAEKKRLIDLYAADELSEGAYVDGNVALDQELLRLTAKRAALLPVLHDADAVGASVRDFCERARARLESCHDFESKRQFLADYVARVIYTRYKVTLRGSVPLRPLADRDQPSMRNALEFRIEGEIKGAMLHGRRSLKFPDDGRLREWALDGRVRLPA